MHDRARYCKMLITSFHYIGVKCTIGSFEAGKSPFARNICRRSIDFKCGIQHSTFIMIILYDTMKLQHACSSMRDGQYRSEGMIRNVRHYFWVVFGTLSKVEDANYSGTFGARQWGKCKKIGREMRFFPLVSGICWYLCNYFIGI